MKLQGTIVNSAASLTLTQSFTNTRDKPIEAIYKFPTDPAFAVTSLSVKIGDKLINAAVMEKQEAKEKYDDAVAAGHSAVKLNFDERIPDVIELNVGQLQVGATAEIVVSIACELEVIKHGFFSLIFPMEFFPRYGDDKGVKGQAGSCLPSEFSLDLTVKSTSVVTNLNVSHEGISFEQSADGKEVRLQLQPSTSVAAKDVVVSYSTEQIREPQITLTKCAKFPGEVAAHISFIPRSSDEHEVEGKLHRIHWILTFTLEEESKDVEEAKGVDSQLTEIDDRDDPEVANGEFIFILDRSGSMGGSRMNVALEALELFIRSIPPNSKFNIISFGSTYEFMHSKSVDYNNDSMQAAINKIKTFGANLGGTELYGPVEASVSLDQDYKCPRNVFVLTDGDISDTESVLSKIREFNHQTRVHSFGIGSGASAYLVKEIAKEGKGSSTLVADNDPNLKAKVIKTLKIASKPAFTNFEVDWKDNTDKLVLVAPQAPYIPNTYEEEPFHCYAILSEAGLANSSVTLKLFSTHEEAEKTIEVVVDSSAIVDSDEGQDFHLAAKSYLDYMRRTSKPDSEQVAISVKYSVLCDKTAFFGKIKNDVKSGEEMETIEIPIKKYSQGQSSHPFVSF